VLTDILGDEDHLGDMDFKVVGTSNGITGLQMDIKIDGVDRDIMSRALAQANKGRNHILDKMQEALSSPRAVVSEHAPKYVTIKIHPDKIRDIIGPGGKVIREMTAEFESKIDVEDDGTIKIFSNSNESANALVKRIEEITAVPEVGKIYEGEVRTIKDFGAFVQILPGTDGMVDIDNRGRIRLSRKAVLAEGEE
jgi:polyribonucleotide nucleotidyltransferase